MSASRYTALAERLVVLAEPSPGIGLVTIAGSAIGGGAMPRVIADSAALTTRPIVARVIAELCGAELCQAVAVAAALVDICEGPRDLWYVTVAGQPLFGSLALELARADLERTRDELAAALRLEIEGTEAVLAAECGPPESLAAENARLRAQVRELEAQLAEARAQIEQPATVRQGRVHDAPAESGARARGES